jgi:calcineurin-like phosphoesterase
VTKPLTVICVGDVFGEPGRRAVQMLLPKLKKQHEADFAVVNVENSASGFGVTPLIARTFLEQGVDVMTSGNHIWDKKEIIEYIGKENLLLRPANYPPGTPGAGSIVIKAGPHKVAVLNLAACSCRSSIAPSARRTRSWSASAPRRRSSWWTCTPRPPPSRRPWAGTSTGG